MPRFTPWRTLRIVFLLVMLYFALFVMKVRPPAVSVPNTPEAQACWQRCEKIQATCLKRCEGDIVGSVVSLLDGSAFNGQTCTHHCVDDRDQCALLTCPGAQRTSAH